MLIYKIFRANEWQFLQENGETAGAPIDVADGYVHFSTAEQVAETVSKHFSGEGDLFLLALESDTLEPVKWEVSRGGAKFPHLYRALKLTDVLWSKPLPLNETGHIFPDGVLPQ